MKLCLREGLKGPKKYKSCVKKKLKYFLHF